jgi:tRNA-specific 2-thiouridylase
MEMTQQLEFLKAYGIELSAEQVLQNKQKRVIVGMSGGVDSSVTALLVKLMGYETIGIFMKNWEEQDESGQCSSEKDFADVKRVCEQLEIPYYSLNFVDEYRDNVFASFLEEYKQGYTPNPDILCNREIKFKVFFQKAMSLGADYLATGHYCQVEHTENGTYLKKGADNNKDQSYFLYAIEGEVLAHVLFPIGHLQKPQVREIAQKFDLATSHKKDSTGICFIGERNFKEFLAQYIEGSQGEFVELDSGQKQGRHDGVCFYTPGQRKGLGIGGPGGPWFVADKNVETNEVFVVQGENHPALYADDLVATGIHWIHARPQKTKLKAKVRYRQQDQDCELIETADGLKVIFDKPQRAITERQSIVFYDEDLCLGGGFIKSRGASYFERESTKA